MNRLNNSALPLVALSVVLSLSAVIAVAAHWPDRGVAAPAPAVAHRTTPLKTVMVVMHDPGCHWFQTANGGFTRTLSVTGPVKLMNMDEAALKIVGASGTKRAAVGTRTRLAPGTYRITMVGQASDDNHLKLTVS